MTIACKAHKASDFKKLQLYRPRLTQLVFLCNLQVYLQTTQSIYRPLSGMLQQYFTFHASVYPETKIYLLRQSTWYSTT